MRRSPPHLSCCRFSKPGAIGCALKRVSVVRSPFPARGMGWPWIFPPAPWTCADPPAALIRALGNVPSAVLKIEDNYFAIYASQEEVRRIRPDFRLLEQLHPAGVAITAPGDDTDFVSRYFAPSYGIPEDPVTGSTHCSLAPYWAQRLGRTCLHAQQVSERGGEIWCEVRPERVTLKGNAVLTLQGELLI